MVYRGKPSAGCDNCRKAKKRCGLEQPACSRCVKLTKPCSGYRDTSQLQIQDESESVKIKANRQKARTPNPATVDIIHTKTILPSGIPTPETPGVSTDTSLHNWCEETVKLPLNRSQFIDFNTLTLADLEKMDLSLHPGIGMPFALKPQVDDVAMTFFFNHFTASNGHWAYLRDQAARSKIDPMVAIAMRVCGMAAMDNVQGTVMGRQYTRSLYADALGRLNNALRDPRRCRTDETLIAVSMMAYYENLSCDSRQSIQSWKAHVSGATQLLKLRGKAQLKTAQGCMLFREIRTSILMYSIWDALEPPAFLIDWQDNFDLQSGDSMLLKPADTLTHICFDLATFRAHIHRKLISGVEAASRATEIEMKMVDWSINTMTHSGEAWTFYDVEVPDSPHVWNGVVHAYSGHPVPTVWNTYRNVRILLTRTQEMLLHDLQLPQEQEEAQRAYYRSVRRQMADDICAGTPCQLGHAAPAYISPCITITAYSSIWPLFFACTCVLERVGMTAWQAAVTGRAPLASSAAASQACWILGRMDYIFKEIGLGWANGVAAMLRGDFRMHEDLQFEDGGPLWVADGGMKGRIEENSLGLKSQQREGQESQESALCQPYWFVRGGH